MKGFIYLGNNTYINENVIKEKKVYNDCIKYFTIYNEVIKIKREVNKND